MLAGESLEAAPAICQQPGTRHSTEEGHGGTLFPGICKSLLQPLDLRLGSPCSLDNVGGVDCVLQRGQNGPLDQDLVVYLLYVFQDGGGGVDIGLGGCVGVWLGGRVQAKV